MQYRFPCSLSCSTSKVLDKVVQGLRYIIETRPCISYLTALVYMSTRPLCLLAYYLSLTLRGSCWLAGFWPFSTIFRAATTALGNTFTIQRTTHDVITNAWQVFYTATTDKHDRVLLQVMPFTRNVCRNRSEE